jgi:site-specific DNA-cytosine methylase
MGLTFGSLFAGVGGYDMGFEKAGYECKFQVEWDKHCRSVLDYHWPDVPKWGDIRNVDGRFLPPVDVIIFGSPCQDLSVAGKRAGLEGERSGLFHEAVRIIKEMRDATNGTFPRWTVWENVAGALSSNNGRDFATVLNEMAEAGACLQEYALLDASKFGIPQRRRRVFLVSCFDSATAERCPSPLLPVGESLPRDTAKGKPKRKSSATTLTESVGAGGGIVNAIGASIYHHGTVVNQDVGSGHMVVEGYTSSSFAQYQEGVGTLRSNGGDLGGGSETLIAEPYVKSRRAQSVTDDETWVPGEVNPTLNSFDVGDTRSTTAIVFNDDRRIGPTIHGDTVSTLQAFMGTGGNNTPMVAQSAGEEPMLVDGTRVGDVRVYEPPVQTLGARMGTGGNNVPMLAFDTQFGSNANVFEDVAPTLKASQQSPSVAYSIREDAKANNFSATELDHANSLSALRPSPQSHHAQMFIAEPTMAVRRLTPLECERLMGWPDDHTRFKADGTEQADTHRYKQCGNGVASPVAKWVAEQIAKVEHAEG